MNMPADPDPIESLAQYHAYIAEVTELVARDPTTDTPEGMRMLALVDRIEEFERKAWPDMFSDSPADDPGAPLPIESTDEPTRERKQ